MCEEIVIFNVAYNVAYNVRFILEIDFIYILDRLSDTECKLQEGVSVQLRSR